MLSSCIAVVWRLRGTHAHSCLTANLIPCCCVAGADAADEAAAKALEEGGGDQALDESAEPGEEEEAEPAAQHGWDEEQPDQDALPEAGPTGLASQAAAAQVCTRDKTLFP